MRTRFYPQFEFDSTQVRCGVCSGHKVQLGANGYDKCPKALALRRCLLLLSKPESKTDKTVLIVV